MWFVDLVDTMGIRYSILVPYLRSIPERMPPLWRETRESEILRSRETNAKIESMQLRIRMRDNGDRAWICTRRRDTLNNTRSAWTRNSGGWREREREGEREKIRRKTRPEKPLGTLGYFTRCCYASTALLARIIIYVHMGKLLERCWPNENSMRAFEKKRKKKTIKFHDLFLSFFLFVISLI